jgi:uncharacterized DUF497 family protein
MIYFNLEFEWDPKKKQANIQKHGFNFEQAKACFSDPKGFAMEDFRHSKDEQRFFCGYHDQVQWWRE